jgi:hypothetical protein
MVLRSHTPGGVQQEVYGFLLVHYAIRTLTSGFRRHALERLALDGKSAFDLGG